MKSCLDENQLLQLWAAERGDFPDQRSHLAQCPRCTASYDQLVREAGTITDTLTTAVDHLRWRDRTAIRDPYARIREGLRTAAIFSGAAAFGGAAAFALLVTLGWHPAGASNRLAQRSGPTVVAQNAAGRRAASARVANANGELGNAYLSNGALYTVDTLTSDPLAGVGYGNSDQSDNSNAGEDLLFCVPDDDSAMCSPSGEQG